jgi:hypothetical protein
MLVEPINPASPFIWAASIEFVILASHELEEAVSG